MVSDPPQKASFVNDPAPNTPPPRRRRSRAWLWLLLLALLAVAGWRGWLWWQARSDQAQAVQVAQTADNQRLTALEARIETLRKGQRAQAQRLQQAEATNRLLREELLGIGQRAALLEDSVTKLAEPGLRSVQALRLDEVELLLSTAQQRLTLAGDIEGARHAYALAAGLMKEIDDPEWLGLRQAVAQETAAIAATGIDPRGAISERLDRLAAGLAKLPDQETVAQAQPQEDASWLQRLLSRVVQVQPTNADTRLVAPDQREAGLMAVQIELALARAALERRDTQAFHDALTRLDAWLLRLWPASSARKQQRQTLQQLGETSLELSLPELGSSLRQLRAMRASR